MILICNICCLIFGLIWVIPPCLLLVYWIYRHTKIQETKLDKAHELAIKKLEHLKIQNEQIQKVNERNKHADHLKLIVEHDFKKDGNQPDIEKYMNELKLIYKSKNQKDV